MKIARRRVPRTGRHRTMSGLYPKHYIPSYNSLDTAGHEHVSSKEIAVSVDSHWTNTGCFIPILTALHASGPPGLTVTPACKVPHSRLAASRLSQNYTDLTSPPYTLLLTPLPTMSSEANGYGADYDEEEQLDLQAELDAGFADIEQK